MLNKVFFIDDDSVALMISRKLVEKTLFAKETLTAMSGKLALDHYEKWTENGSLEDYPRLVFLDLNMPMVDGWDFLNEFSKRFYTQFKETRIVILSSSINPEDRERSKMYPMVIDFIPKPVTFEILESFKDKF